MKYLTALILSLTLSFPMQARELDSAEQALLESSLNAFILALENKEMDAVVAIIPPKIIKTIATGAKIAPDKLREMMVNGMATVMKDASFSDLEIDTNSLDANENTAPDGSNVTYMFVPFNFKMQVNGATYAITSSILALKENDVWYFLRIDEEQQKTILIKTYPFFEGTEFPAHDIKAM